jgi:hypothetical protein
VVLLLPSKIIFGGGLTAPSPFEDWGKVLKQNQIDSNQIALLTLEQEILLQI